MCRDSKGKYKFSFMEMITSGRNGSTSATGFIGVVLSLVCIEICRLAVSLGITRFKITGGEPLVRKGILSLLDKVIIMLGIGSALLGTRKISGVIGSKNNAEGIQRAVEDALNAREEKEEKMRTKIFLPKIPPSGANPQEQ